MDHRNDGCCRLCLSTNSIHLDIFSAVGIEMKMGDIISEHFKCEVSESDSLPNIVCQVCWSVTEAFHEVFLKSKHAQEQYLNLMIIKREPDCTDSWPNKGDIFVDEIRVDQVKLEVNPSDDIPIGFDGSDEDSYDNENEHEIDNDNDNYNDNCNDNEIRDKGEPKDNGNTPAKVDARAKNTQCTPKSHGVTPKVVRNTKKRADFAALFDENKHQFDLACDLCTTVFQTLDEARSHYPKLHGILNGYIKCCNTKLTHQCRVERHLKRHKKPKHLTCDICNKWVKNLKLHVIKSHSNQENDTPEDFQCDVCKKVFTNKKSMRLHLKRHAKMNTPVEDQYHKFMVENFDLKCEQCEYIFSTFRDAKNHYKEKHNEINGYLKCCSIKLKKNVFVRDHIKSHLNPDIFKCDICAKTFTTKLRLSQHKLRHRKTMNKKYICDFCGKACRDKEACKNHIFTNHVTSEPKYECEFCHKKFHLPNLLKNHFYSVHREKKRDQTCEVCGRGFYQKFHLNKHMLSHIDISERLSERVQCEHCGEWLMSKSGVYYHKQIHTTGVQKCEECQIEVPNRNSLLAHNRKYHREQKFKCKFCNKAFQNGSLLKKHEESHTRHNTYQCKFCPKVFNIRSSLQTHRKRNHPEEMKMLAEMRKKCPI